MFASLKLTADVVSLAADGTGRRAATVVAMQQSTMLAIKKDVFDSVIRSVSRSEGLATSAETLQNITVKEPGDRMGEEIDLIVSLTKHMQVCSTVCLSQLLFALN